MATATKETKEKKDTEVVECDPVANWKMPEVSIGDDVIWYPGATSSDTPSSAKVIHVPLGGRNVELRVQGRDQQFTKRWVRHIDDPELMRNPTIREFGAWDYRNQYRDLLKRIEALEALMK